MDESLSFNSQINPAHWRSVILLFFFELYLTFGAAEVLAGSLKTAICGHFKTDQREGAGPFRSSFIERFLGLWSGSQRSSPRRRFHNNPTHRFCYRPTFPCNVPLPWSQLAQDLFSVFVERSLQSPGTMINTKVHGRYTQG